MESLAQQTALNATLRAEVRALKEAAALRQRALRFSPPVLGNGGDAPRPAVAGAPTELMGEDAVRYIPLHTHTLRLMGEDAVHAHTEESTTHCTHVSRAFGWPFGCAVERLAVRLCG